jgi:translation initiation factor IF-1
MSFELYIRNEKQVICKICNKKFKSKFGAQVCSDECIEARKQIWINNKKKKQKTFKVTCKYCKKVKEYDQNPNNRAYCDNKCKSAAYRLKKKKEIFKLKQDSIQKKEINPMFLTRGIITYNKE